jgi:hypothetical protein
MSIHRPAFRPTLVLPSAKNDGILSERLSLMKQNENDVEELLFWAFPSLSEAMNDSNATIGPSTIGSGNGLFVTRPIKKHDAVMVIPSEKIICVENAWEDDTLGEEFMYLTDVGGPGAKLATLAGFLAKEASGGVENSFQQQSDLSQTSAWQPYLDCLPWKDDHVLWWSEEETERLLKGSNIYKEVVSMRLQVEIAIENIQNIFWNYCCNNDESLQEQEDSLRALNDDDKAMQKIATAVRSSFCMLLSRAFEDEDFDCMKLIPVLDMIQHNSESVNVRHETDPSTGDVLVTAKRDLQMGEELFNCYSTTLTSAQYLTVFGFVPNDKGLTARKLLENKDPVFFSSDEQ